MKIFRPNPPDPLPLARYAVREVVGEWVVLDRQTARTTTFIDRGEAEERAAMLEGLHRIIGNR